MADLRLLGTIGLQSANGRELRALLAQPRRVALLAYLAAATPGGAHARDTLLGVFWPELDQAHGRAALRQALHVLRVELGAEAIRNRGAEAVVVDRDVLWCDVDAFTQAASEGRAGPALDLYRGDLLEGFFIAGAPEFEQWLESERRRLRETACHCARDLADRAEAAGDRVGAAAWIRRAARLAPHDELLLRQLLTILDALDDRAGAVAAYEQFARRLQRDFEILPSAATQALAAEVRARHAAGLAVPATAAHQRRTADDPAPPAARLARGRERELALLRDELARVASGRSTLVCVTGEAGIGKTTLVEAFLAEVEQDRGAITVARGRCSERLAGADAYLPLLEILQTLARGERAGSLAALMRHLAPTWFAQVCADAGTAREGDAGRGSPERMKLELGGLLEAASRRSPCVLFLDDVHWIDRSTADMLAYLGGRFTDMRLLVVASFRPTELLRRDNGFHPLVLEMQARGLCREVAVPFFTPAQIGDHLAVVFPGHSFPTDFAATLHVITEGSALFLVDVVRYLRDRSVIAEEGGRWVLAQPLPVIGRVVPESIRGMIQRQLGYLSGDDQSLLRVASVQGHEFDSAIVARALGEDAGTIEDRLHVLAERHGLVRLLRDECLAGTTPSARYRFVHILYQNALDATLTPTRRAALSAVVARALVELYGDDDRVAAEAAVLLETAGDHPAAARYFLQAANRAARLFASREAAILAARGLRCLEAAPAATERDRDGLALHIALGVALAATHGWGTDEVVECYDRARLLCERVADPRQTFTVLAGQWRAQVVRARLGAGRETAQRMLELAQSLGEPALLVEAHHALSWPLNHCGEHRLGHHHAERGIALYDPARHHAQCFVYAQDPGLECYTQSARALWVLGFPDQAAQRTEASFVVARRLAQPSNLVWAYVAKGILHQLRGEPAQSLACWDEVTRLSAQHGLTQSTRWAKAWYGWARARCGELDAGIREVRDGLDILTAFGELTRPQCSALLAELLAERGEPTESLAVIAGALAVIERTGGRYYEAELHRLRGEVLLLTGSPRAGVEAAAAFMHAMDLAAARGARSFELRAAMSLSRLLARDGRRDEARELLGPVRGWFTEGFDSPDLMAASAMLAQLA